MEQLTIGESGLFYTYDLIVHSRYCIVEIVTHIASNSTSASPTANIDIRCLIGILRIIKHTTFSSICDRITSCVRTIPSKPTKMFCIISYFLKVSVITTWCIVTNPSDILSTICRIVIPTHIAEEVSLSKSEWNRGLIVVIINRTLYSMYLLVATGTQSRIKTIHVGDGHRNDHIPDPVVGIKSN